MYYADENLTCPYDKSHVVRKSRMPIHLTKCKKNTGTENMVMCPYNAIHMVLQSKAEEHQRYCPNRIVLDSFLYQGSAPRLPDGVLPAGADNFNPSMGNTWDSPVQGSVIESVRLQAKGKDVYLTLTGASRAVKNAYRNDERKRFAQVSQQIKSASSSSSWEIVDSDDEKLIEDVKECLSIENSAYAPDGSTFKLNPEVLAKLKDTNPAMFNLVARRWAPNLCIPVVKKPEAQPGPSGVAPSATVKEKFYAPVTHSNPSEIDARRRVIMAQMRLANNGNEGKPRKEDNEDQSLPWNTVIHSKKRNGRNGEN